MAPNEPQPNPDRAARIRRIIDDVVRRRASGEMLADEQVLSAHPDLMPELRKELEKLEKLVDGLRGIAPNPPAPADNSTRTDSTEAGDGAAPPKADAEPAAIPAKRPDAPRLAKDAFPGYEIVRTIDTGGQGAVFQAIQKGTNRKVAIKVLIDGPYASAAARRRFEREIELVAQLKHPNIISIFHSGETADGRQYYVMDYVRGKPLNQYVREKKLTLEEALRLFSKVCDAVQYAHQRGIVHRDLKPSNILVHDPEYPSGSGRLDDSSVEEHIPCEPKVLDFGLAKWLVSPTETIVSQSQDVIGTLPYMSPEQTRGSAAEIDARTDVYSLGVILYEMLTGTFPYPVTGPMVEVARHIAETEPMPLGRAWQPERGVRSRSSSRRAAGAVDSGSRSKSGWGSWNRQLPPASPIRGDVETIVMKALAKERSRRYASAEELGKDVEFFMLGRPISARSQSYSSKVTSGVVTLVRKSPRIALLVSAAAAAIFANTIGVLLIFEVLKLDTRWRTIAMLVRGPIAREFAHVHVIELGPNLDPESIAKDAGIPGVSNDEDTSRLLLHAALLNRLRIARPRAIALVMGFSDDSPHVCQITEAMQQLQQAQIGVVVQAQEWGLDDAGLPRVLPEVGALAVAAPCTGDIEDQEPWSVDLAIESERDPVRAGFSLAAAIAHHRLSTRYNLKFDESNDMVHVSYFDYDPLRAQESHIDNKSFRISAITEETNKNGILGVSDELKVAKLLVELPSDKVLNHIVTPYDKALKMPSDELAALVRGKTVVVTNTRVSKSYKQDLHGRRLHRSLAQAVAIETLLAGQTIRVPSAAASWLIVITAACVAVVLEQFSRLSKTASIFVLAGFGICVTAVSILIFSATGYLCNPIVPTMAFCLSFAGSAGLHRTLRV